MIPAESRASAAKPPAGFQSLPKLSFVGSLIALKHRLGGLPSAQLAEHLERLVHQVGRKFAPQRVPASPTLRFQPRERLGSVPPRAHQRPTRALRGIPGRGCYRPCKIAQKWPSKMSDVGRVTERWLRRGVRVSIRVPGRFHTMASPPNGGDAMIGRETRVLLRHYLEQGMSKAAIARQVGINARTVYRWIAAGQLDRELDDGAVRYGPRPSRPSKLDPYRGIIDTRLAEYPELSAVRLFNEVQAAGYPGGYGQVKRYVREVRPRPPEEPVQRFETPPGHQAQVDFAEFRLPWGKRYALIVGAGLLAADVGSVLRAPDDGGGDAGAGVGVPLLPRRALGTPVRPDEGGHHRGRPRGRAAGWWRTGSSCASASTGASASGRAAPTGPRRRARSSGWSATSGRTSSTAGSSGRTMTSTRRCCCGSTPKPTSGSTGR